MSYESLKTIAGKMEKWVQKITDGAEAKLDAEWEQRSADATAAAPTGWCDFDSTEQTCLHSAEL